MSVHDIAGLFSEFGDFQKHHYPPNRFTGRHPLYLYGAGHLGATTAKALKARGITPAAFIDNTPSKWGKHILGIPIVRLENIKAEDLSDAIVVVTIWNDKHRYLSTRQHLKGYFRETAHFLELAYSLPESFLPSYCFDDPQKTLQHSLPAIQGFFDQLTDAKSRDEFYRHLKFRLTLDFDCLPLSKRQRYFDRDVFTPGSDWIYVDAGAYNGDTILEFLEANGRCRRIVAFEPDGHNFSALELRVAKQITPDLCPNLQLINAAVGAQPGRLAFSSGNGQGSRLSSDGMQSVEVCTLDDLHGMNGRMYLKFDVEGGESEALAGARRLLRTFQPLLAISAYHLPADIWTLAEQVSTVNPKYTFAFRTEGEDGLGSVVYAW
jgi:FkbM family methyltransferase